LRVYPLNTGAKYYVSIVDFMAGRVGGRGVLSPTATAVCRRGNHRTATTLVVTSPVRPSVHSAGNNPHKKSLEVVTILQQIARRIKMWENSYSCVIIGLRGHTDSMK